MVQRVLIQTSDFKAGEFIKFYQDEYFFPREAVLDKITLFHLEFLLDPVSQLFVFFLSPVHFLELGIYGIFSPALPLTCWRSAIRLTLNTI